MSWGLLDFPIEGNKWSWVAWSFNVTVLDYTQSVSDLVCILKDSDLWEHGTKVFGKKKIMEKVAFDLLFFWYYIADFSLNLHVSPRTSCGRISLSMQLLEKEPGSWATLEASFLTHFQIKHVHQQAAYGFDKVHSAWGRQATVHFHFCACSLHWVASVGNVIGRNTSSSASCFVFLSVLFPLLSAPHATVS